MKQYYIYLTTNLISGKKYIGQHFGELNDKYLGSGLALVDAIKKYGKANFSKKILEICTKDTIDDKEKYWIAFYDAFNDDNYYNLTEGGQHGDGWKAAQRYFAAHPQEAQKLYQQNGKNLQEWGINNPDKVKENIDKMLEAAHKYWKDNPNKLQEHLQVMMSAQKQWQQENPEEYQRLIDQWRKSGSDANSKKIRCITTGEIFKSLSEAERQYKEYGVRQANLTKCLHGERHSCGKKNGQKLQWEFI